MSKALRTTLGLVVSVVLFSAVLLAQASGINTSKGEKKNREHHSHLAKLAFWRHQRDNDKSVKKGQAQSAHIKPAQAKAAQMIKPMSAKPSAGKKNEKKEQQAKKISKAPA